MSGNKLATTFRVLISISRQAINHEAPSISNAQLPKIAEGISIDRVQAKPNTDENLLSKWRISLKTNTFDKLTNRELRKLSWEPEVTLESEYLRVLESRNLPLNRSLIKCLIYSILSDWGNVRGRSLQTYLIRKEQEGVNSSYLKKVSPFILTESGPLMTADFLISNMSSVQKAISEIFGITASTTLYAQSVMSMVIEQGHQKVLSDNFKERLWFYSEVLQYVNKETLLICLERVISAIDQSQNEGAKEELKKFILFHAHLGDPRLPGYEGNWPKEKVITKKVIEWLSQSDIKFFFELFIEKQSDRQGRKQFWLKFAHLAKGTRVIVSSHDQSRLARQITDMKQKSGTSNLFADLSDTSEKATVFMMDFGRLIVVEFSLSNHACYYYEPHGKFKYADRNKFWNTGKFSISDLKKKRLCNSPLTHRDGWEENFENILAGFGLRPNSERVGIK